jgi:hypothetical protein
MFFARVDQKFAIHIAFLIVENTTTGQTNKYQLFSGAVVVRAEKCLQIIIVHKTYIG